MKGSNRGFCDRQTVSQSSTSHLGSQSGSQSGIQSSNHDTLSKVQNIIKSQYRTWSCSKGNLREHLLDYVQDFRSWFYKTGNGPLACVYEVFYILCPFTTAQVQSHQTREHVPQRTQRKATCFLSSQYIFIDDFIRSLFILCFQKS